MGLTVCVAQERDQGRREKRLNRALVRCAFGCGSAFSRVGFGAVVGARVSVFVGCWLLIRFRKKQEEHEQAPPASEVDLNEIRPAGWWRFFCLGIFMPRGMDGRRRGS